MEGQAALKRKDIEAMQNRDQLVGIALAKIVSLLMNSSAHSHLRISDLKWLVLPPLLADQFAIMEAVREGTVLPSPIAAAVWARVSPELDRRLAADKDRSVRLAPEEWQSGDILWIIDAVGDPRILPAFLEELAATRFPGRYPKMRQIGKSSIAKIVFVGLDNLQEEP
jgi:hemolysin-activating ACP:hemolysin acyltransferase